MRIKGLKSACSCVLGVIKVDCSTTYVYFVHSSSRSSSSISIKRTCISVSIMSLAMIRAYRPVIFSSSTAIHLWGIFRSFIHLSVLRFRIASHSLRRSFFAMTANSFRRTLRITMKIFPVRFSVASLVFRMWRGIPWAQVLLVVVFFCGVRDGFNIVVLLGVGVASLCFA